MLLIVGVLRSLRVPSIGLNATPLYRWGQTITQLTLAGFTQNKQIKLMNQEWVSALWGGVLIGISASIMLLSLGRVTGIAGILSGLFQPAKNDVSWRVSFLGGLFAGGIALKLFRPEVFTGTIFVDDWIIIIAGILVGFGTVLGSGCTSGHGVCGISRLSLRSIVATLVFITSGVLTVVVFRHLGVIW